MKNFDEERRLRETTDRSFQIGGETFTYKASVAPEVVLHWNQAVTGEAGELSEQAWLDLFDETTLAILDPGQRDKWEAVRDPGAQHPLNISDLREVLKYLIAEATGRPTSPPSGSSPGGDITETQPRAGSSSPEERASTTSTPARSAP